MHDYHLTNVKHNVLSFKYPTPLYPLVQGFPLLHVGTTVFGIALVPPLNITQYGDYYIDIGMTMDLTQKAGKSETNTALALKANQIPLVQ